MCVGVGDWNIITTKWCYYLKVFCSICVHLWHFVCTSAISRNPSRQQQKCDIYPPPCLCLGEFFFFVFLSFSSFCSFVKVLTFCLDSWLSGIRWMGNENVMSASLGEEMYKESSSTDDGKRGPICEKKREIGYNWLVTCHNINKPFGFLLYVFI